MGSNDGTGLITFLDLNLVAPNTIRFYAIDSASHVVDAYATAPSGVSLSDGAYHHYVTTISGNGLTPTVAIYLDGQPLPVTYTTRTPLSAAAVLQHDLYLGALNNISSPILYCAGELDEVAFYPTVLSAEPRAVPLQRGHRRPRPGSGQCRNAPSCSPATSSARTRPTPMPKAT